MVLIRERQRHINRDRYPKNGWMGEHRSGANIKGSIHSYEHDDTAIRKLISDSTFHQIESVHINEQCSDITSTFHFVMIKTDD
jgi:hypothetical protein